MMKTRTLGSVAAVGAAVAVAAGAVLGSTGDGRAQAGGRTFTVTYSARQPQIDFLDVGRPGLTRTGRTTLGDQIFFATAVLRDDGARGRLSATVTATGPGNLQRGRGSGVAAGVYRFADGDITVAGATTLREQDVDHLAVTGGTGAFAGARGTVDSGATTDVIRLLP